MKLRPGDIVKHEEAPCEVLAACKDSTGAAIVFIMNKRTLLGSFQIPADVEFVRHSNTNSEKFVK